MPTQGSSVKFQFGTQTNYDAITSKNNNTFYITTDTQRIYLGENLYSGASSSNIVSCTTVEYNNITTTAGTIYLVIDGNAPYQTFTLRDSLGNIIQPGTSSNNLNISPLSIVLDGQDTIISQTLIGQATALNEN